jgi:hypothetical protein
MTLFEWLRGRKAKNPVQDSREFENLLIKAWMRQRLRRSEMNQRNKATSRK